MEDILRLIELEQKRQNEGIELIASENYASKNVRSMCGSILTNKYAEGYPGRRYYGGCEYIDEIERIAIKEACDMDLKCTPVSTADKNEFDFEPPYEGKPTGIQTFSSYGYIYTLIKKSNGEDMSMGHGYHRPFKSKAAEDDIWKEIMRSSWFYDETGIELFTKTSYE